LSNEECCDGLVEGCPVHVDGGTDGKNKLGNSGKKIFIEKAADNLRLYF
jgi:hypothetical protein